MRKHKITIKGITFASAHFITGHIKCGRLHGHNYRMDVTLKGKINHDTGMVEDFSKVKKTAKMFADWLDHRVIIPYPWKDDEQYKLTGSFLFGNDVIAEKISYSEIINKILYTITMEFIPTGQDDNGNVFGKNIVLVSLDEKHYKFPAKDVMFLRIPITSAEYMAQLLADSMKLEFPELDVWVTLYETDTSYAQAKGEKR